MRRRQDVHHAPNHPSHEGQRLRRANTELSELPLRADAYRQRRRAGDRGVAVAGVGGFRSRVIALSQALACDPPFSDPLTNQPQDNQIFSETPSTGSCSLSRRDCSGSALVPASKSEAGGGFGKLPLGPSEPPPSARHCSGEIADMPAGRRRQVVSLFENQSSTSIAADVAIGMFGPL